MSRSKFYIFLYRSNSSMHVEFSFLSLLYSINSLGTFWLFESLIPVITPIKSSCIEAYRAKICCLNFYFFTSSVSQCGSWQFPFPLLTFNIWFLYSVYSMSSKNRISFYVFARSNLLLHRWIAMDASYEFLSSPDTLTLKSCVYFLL